MKILRITVGIILLVFGIFALLTPLTPGAFLGLIGLELLGFGFLIPKKLRDFWEKSSLNLWLEKKLSAYGYPEHEAQSSARASLRDPKDIQSGSSPPPA